MQPNRKVKIAIDRAAFKQLTVQLKNMHTQEVEVRTQDSKHGVQSHLNYRKFKLALNPMYRIC